MVEGQNAGDDVVGAVTGNLRHSVTHAEKTHVAQTCSLGKPGRTRGEHMKEVVTGDQALAPLGRHAFGTQAAEGRSPVARVTDLDGCQVLGGKAGKPGGALASGQERARPAGRQRVLERSAAQIAVDERRSNSELSHTGPCRDVFGAVLHHQAGDVATDKPHTLV